MGLGALRRAHGEPYRVGVELEAWTTSPSARCTTSPPWRSSGIRSNSDDVTHVLLSAMSWRHNYVPQFLLRPWCNEEGELWACYRLHTGKLQRRRISPRGTGYERDLYRQEPVLRGVRADNQGDPDSVEKAYSGLLETPAARIHEKLVAGTLPSALTSSERKIWAEFVATLEHRSPRSIKNLSDSQEPSASDLRAEFRAMYAQELPEEIDLEALLHNTARSVALTRRAELAGNVHALEWCTITSDVELITADYPLAFFAGDDGRVGFCLPLSPHTLFAAAAIRKGDWSSTLAKWIVLCTNLLIIYQAPHYVYSRSKLEDGPVWRLLTAADERLVTP